MTILNYYLPSGSITGSVTAIPDNSTDSAVTYYGVTLEITASSYDTVGTTFASTINDVKVYIRSSSIAVATYPLDTVTINYIYSDPTLVSFALPALSASFPTVFSFLPNTVFTSSNDAFSVYNTTKSTYYGFISQSQENFESNLIQNDNHILTLSGSGLFYASSITVVNLNTRTTSSFITGSNTYISTSLSSSNNNTYNVTATTSTLPYIQLAYSGSVFPVTPSSSLSGWNTHLGITASYISNSADKVYLAGENLYNLTEITLPGFDGIYQFTPYGMYNLYTASILYNNLYSVPLFTGAPNIASIDISHNLITGSNFNLTSSTNLQYLNTSINSISGSIQEIINSIPTSSIQYLDLSSNNLTGSIPILTSSYALTNFYCGSNSLSGSISSLNGNYFLQIFDCSYNALTGSIPSISDCPNLQYFYCNNNKLTGQLPTNLSSSYSLNWFDVSNNNLTGSIPLITGSLRTFYCHYNQLSGSIGSFNGATNLVNFNCSHNRLTGSIPYLVNCSNLSYFNCGYNQLSNYSGSSTTTSSFDGPGLPPTLTQFYAQYNQLKESDVDNILYDLDKAGSTGGTLFISGSNATPSAFGKNLAVSLANKGWTVNHT